MPLALLSVNVKDERNMDEWIDYHLRLGFSNILIWDDASNPPFSSYDDRVFVIFKPNLKKIQYMNDSIEFAKEHGFVFMMHLDADEYLHVGSHDNNLHEFINDIPVGVISIYFSWLLYGSNHHIHHPPSNSCIFTYRRRAPTTHQYIKPFVRVENVLYASTAHAYRYNVKQTEYNTRYAPLDHATRIVATLPELCKPPLHSSCFIAHYRSQSWDDFRNRKGRPRDDNKKGWKIPFSLETPLPPPIFQKDNNQVECNIMTIAYQNLLQRK